MRYSQYKYSKGRYGTADLLEGASAVSSHSSIANVSAVRVRTSGALAAGATVVVTEAFSTVKGAGAFSSNATTTCAAQRIHQGAATPTVASSIVGVGQLVREVSATSSGISSIALSVERVRLFSATMTSTVSITAKGGYVRFGEATATPTASVIAVGRLKWSFIAEGEEEWTPIVNDSVTWTQETNDSVTWTQIAA